jgi:hypothetical protein
MLMKRLFTLAALAAATCGAVHAQSADQIVSEFGLFGTWATDCSRPATPLNIHTVYSLSGGTVRLRYRFGPVEKADSTITRAERISSDQILYEEEPMDGGRGRVEVVLAMAGGRIQVWRSRRPNGQLLVQDGRFTSNGAESPRQDKCRD